ncbi:SCAN domain protein [Trichonephila clavipes]|nr:SCAN domain protein [Trichonephila clavipes]
MLNCFECGLTQIPTTDESIPIQEHRIEISVNEGLQPMFEQGYHKFWLQKQIPILYPELWVIVQKLLTTSASSRLEKRGFSAVKDLITKKKTNRLKTSVHWDLRLLLTNSGMWT